MSAPSRRPRPANDPPEGAPPWAPQGWGSPGGWGATQPAAAPDGYATGLPAPRQAAARQPWDAETTQLPAQEWTAAPGDAGPLPHPAEPSRPPAPTPDAAGEPLPRSRQRALARARARARRRRLTVAAVLLVAVVLVGADVVSGRRLAGIPGLPPHRAPATAAAGAAGTAPDGPAPATGASGAKPDPGKSAAAPTASVPVSGPGTFAYAGGTGPVIGTGGTVHKYRVAVENGTGQNATDFASIAQQTLSDQRSWIKGGDVRFQRVGQSATAEFTLYLATPATSEKMCAKGGIHTQRLISCRIPGQVIIDLALWQEGAPGYGASLATYRQFTLNHEIGRQLGHGDEGCRAPGALASVMQEQTLGLAGCVANAWPYVNGTRYYGTPMP